MPVETTPLSCSNSFPSLASTAILQTSEMLNTARRFLVLCAMINVPNENVGHSYWAVLAKCKMMNESKQKLNTIFLSSGVWQTGTLVPLFQMNLIPPSWGGKFHHSYPSNYMDSHPRRHFFFKIHFSISAWIFQAVSFLWISPSKCHMCVSSFLFIPHACLS
jgi:hypothetical protein